MTVKSKFRRYIHTAFIIIPMTLLMTFIACIWNSGWQTGLGVHFIKTWLVMFPVAYCAALIIFPFAGRLTGKMNFID